MAWIILASSLVAPSGAQAQIPEPIGAPSEADEARARQHFQAGQNHFSELQYDEAAREFAEAWRFSGRAEMLFNLSIALERALEFDRAIEAVERYLAVAPPDAEQRPLAERRLDRLRTLRDRQRAQAQGRTPPGPAPAPEPDDARPIGLGSDDGGGGSTTAGWIVLAGGAAAGVVAVITGLLAHSTYSDLEDACPGDVCDISRRGDSREASALAWVSTVLTGVAIAAAGVGVTLIVIGGGSDDERPIGAMLRTQVRF